MLPSTPQLRSAGVLSTIVHPVRASLPRAQASSSSSQGQPLLKQAVIGIASAAALAGAALVFVQQRQRRGDAPDVPPPRTGWLPLGRRSADAELAFIEAKRAREAAHELQQWDQRWRLRSATLSELRAMAARFKVPGRARMRKAELVAALEATMGLAEAVQGGRSGAPSPRS